VYFARGKMGKFFAVEIEIAFYLAEEQKGGFAFCKVWKRVGCDLVSQIYYSAESFSGNGKWKVLGN
jgi:hypothetical protein